MEELFKEIKEYSQKEMDWISTEFERSTQLEEAIEKKNLGLTKKIYNQIARAEKRAFKFQRKLNADLQKLTQIRVYSEDINPIKNKIEITSKRILLILSKSGDSYIKQTIDQLESSLKKEKENLKYIHYSDQSWKNLLKLVQSLNQWIEGLEINIKLLWRIYQKIENEEQAKKKRDDIILANIKARKARIKPLEEERPEAA